MKSLNLFDRNEKDMENDIRYMQLALAEARKAYDLDEVPVGCVIVKDDKIIARRS